MKAMQKIVSLFPGKTIHFLQPYWKKEQWEIALGYPIRDHYKNSARKLEEEISSLSGATCVQSFNLGRSAIKYVLDFYDFPKDSEVIVPSFCCAGVITPILFSGLKPVLVDIDEDFNILASSVEEAISPITKVIILPLLSGKLAKDFFQILNLAERNKIKVIVDATQSLGLSIEGKWVGIYGDAGIYSFNGGKLIPGSSGGLLITNNLSLIDHISQNDLLAPDIHESDKRLVRFMYRHSLRRVTYPFIRINDVLSRFNRKENAFDSSLEKHKFEIRGIYPVEAELAFSQLKFLPEIIMQRQKNAQHLIQSGVLQNFGFHIPDMEHNVFTKFLITHKDHLFSQRIRNRLTNSGIETEQSYTPLALREFGAYSRKLDTPNTDLYWKGAFCIPINPFLDSDDMDRIISVLKSA